MERARFLSRPHRKSMLFNFKNIHKSLLTTETLFTSFRHVIILSLFISSVYNFNLYYFK